MWFATIFSIPQIPFSFVGCFLCCAEAFSFDVPPHVYFCLGVRSKNSRPLVEFNWLLAQLPLLLWLCFHRFPWVPRSLVERRGRDYVAGHLDGVDDSPSLFWHIPLGSWNTCYLCVNCLVLASRSFSSPEIPDQRCSTSTDGLGKISNFF